MDYDLGNMEALCPLSIFCPVLWRIVLLEEATAGGCSVAIRGRVLDPEQYLDRLSMSKQLAHEYRDLKFPCTTLQCKEAIIAFHFTSVLLNFCLIGV